MLSGEAGEHGAAIYGLNYHSRSLACVLGDKENSRFLVGTLSLRDENELHLIQVEGDAEDISCIAVFPHREEIWNIAPSPSDPSIVCTISNGITEDKQVERTAIVYKMNLETSTLETLISANTENYALNAAKNILWQADTSVIAVLNDFGSSFFNINEGKATPVIDLNLDWPTSTTCGSWDAHFQDQLCICSDKSVQAFDIRTKKSTWGIHVAHTQTIRSIDFNPNRPYVFVSAGDDCKGRFWDYRSPKEPLLELELHSHWVWAVRYNPFHDQLVVSAGSDADVKLWDFSGVSSQTIIAGKSSSNLRPSDLRLIQVYDAHEDSVYSVAWSSCDPWIFASLSYDGRAAICSVPQKERMSILLADEGDIDTELQSNGSSS